jgi:hypothetical protein
MQKLFSPATIKIAQSVNKNVNERRTFFAFVVALFAATVILGMTALVYFSLIAMGAFGTLGCVTCDSSISDILWLVPIGGGLVAMVVFWGAFISLRQKSS